MSMLVSASTSQYRVIVPPQSESWLPVRHATSRGGVIFHIHTKRIKQIGGGADRVRFTILRYCGGAIQTRRITPTRGFTGGIISGAKRIKNIGGVGRCLCFAKPRYGGGAIQTRGRIPASVFTGGIIGCAKRIKQIGGGTHRVRFAKPRYSRPAIGGVICPTRGFSVRIIGHPANRIKRVVHTSFHNTGGRFGNYRFPRLPRKKSSAIRQSSQSYGKKQYPQRPRIRG